MKSDALPTERHRVPNPPRLGYLVAVGLVALAAAALVHPLDLELVRALNPDTPGRVDVALEIIADLLPRIFLSVAVVLGAVLLAGSRRPDWRRVGALVLLAPFVSSAVGSAIKAMAGRPRPLLVAPEELRQIVDLADLKSFPSGHVAGATVFALSLLFLLPAGRARLLVLAIIPAMMWDRVALAVHFPSDTLAGVALGCFLVAALWTGLRRTRLEVARRHRTVVVVLGLILVSYSWSEPPRATDPVSGEEVPGLSLAPQRSRTAFEPLLGPPLELAQTSDPRGLVVAAIPWILGVTVLMALLLRRRSRRARTVGLALCLGLPWVWGLLALGGRLPGDRFVVREAEGIFLDPHVHGSDPVDDARPVEFVLERLRSRGIHAVVLSNHDAGTPSPHAIAGSEWSGLRHPDPIWIHIVMIGGEGAAEAVLDESDALDAVRVARSHDSVVIVAHYWSTQRAMSAAGHPMPTPEEFVAAGVSGFEIANRQPVGPGQREAVRQIDALCRRHGLLRLATSDDHGRAPAGSPCITFLPGSFSKDPVLRREEVLERLREGGPVVPVIFARPGNIDATPLPLRPGLMGWEYLRSLSLGGRLSWLFWVGVGSVVLRWRRRRPR